VTWSTKLCVNTCKETGGWGRGGTQDTKLQNQLPLFENTFFFNGNKSNRSMVLNAKRQSRLQFDAHCGVHSRRRVGQGSWFRRIAVKTPNLTVNFLTIPKCSTHATPPRHLRCCCFVVVPLLLFVFVDDGCSWSCCLLLLLLLLLQLLSAVVTPWIYIVQWSNPQVTTKTFYFSQRSGVLYMFRPTWPPSENTHKMYEIAGRELSA
jgi:hypothetical protein